MSRRETRPSRRRALKTLGALGAATAMGAAGEGAEVSGPRRKKAGGRFFEELRKRIDETPIVDTHEHLPDEDERLRGEHVSCDDWGVLFSHYLDSDLVSSGMSVEARNKLCGRGVDPRAKWKLLAPYWPFVKNTGYGQAVRLSMEALYGIQDLDEKTIPRLQDAYTALRKPGMYRKVLVDTARIESCQVNYVWRAFKESRLPTLLTQDLSFLQMHVNLDIAGLAGPAGKKVEDVGDWHDVIRWWFEKYAPYAVAVKSQAAYSRGLDYERVPAERVQGIFKRYLQKDPLTPQENKRLEDHLFWFCVDEATRHGLPVKLHTGYYAGQNGMPLSRVAGNPGELTELCRKSPATTFVFMHICYPFWQDLVAVAKHYTNAHVDMCWAWIIDPAESKEFLKSYLVAAPSNKILTFGGDYIPVECVAGHARMARRGIARALEELVDDGWLRRKDALELVDPILRGNARRIFHLDEKLDRLARAPWL